MNMLMTQEGLYLTTEEATGVLLNAKQSEVDLSAMHEMLLSESDGSAIKTSKAIDQNKLRLCEHLATFLKLLTLSSDVFDVFRDSKGIEHVFYSLEGLIYLPKCHQVKNITIVEEDEETRIKYGFFVQV